MRLTLRAGDNRKVRLTLQAGEQMDPLVSFLQALPLLLPLPWASSLSKTCGNKHHGMTD